MQKDKGTLVFPIGRNPADRRKMCVNAPDGRDAITHFEVVERLPGVTLVECRLETGRTHQIRVHMHHIGHGLIGDPVYCAKESYRKQRLESDLRDYGLSSGKIEEVLDKVIPLNGQLLTSHRIAFPHPFKDERVIDIRIDLPKRFQGVLDLFREL
jgi:23S rRNA pseudouridine1911/1915/1917 synthase